MAFWGGTAVLGRKYPASFELAWRLRVLTGRESLQGRIGEGLAFAVHNIRPARRENTKKKAKSIRNPICRSNVFASQTGLLPNAARSIRIVAAMLMKSVRQSTFVRDKAHKIEQTGAEALSIANDLRGGAVSGSNESAFFEPSIRTN